MTFQTFSQYNYLLDEEKKKKKQEQKPSQIAAQEQKPTEFKTFKNIGADALSFKEPDVQKKVQQPVQANQNTSIFSQVTQKVSSIFSPPPKISQPIQVTQQPQKNIFDTINKVNQDTSVSPGNVPNKKIIGPQQKPDVSKGNTIIGPKDTVLSQAPKQTVWDKISNTIGQMFDSSQSQKARAMNAVAVKKTPVGEKYSLTALAEKSGNPLKNTAMDMASKELGIRNIPTNSELVEDVFTAAVGFGLLTNPVATAIGIGGFAGINNLKSGLISTIQGKGFDPNSNKTFSDLAPNAPSDVKTLLDVADFLVTAKVTHNVFKAAPNIFSVLTKDVIVKYNLPETINIPAAEVKRVVIGTNTGVEKDVLASLGLTGDQWKKAVSNGVTVEIPSEKITNIVDKPYWEKMKRIIGKEPTNLVTRSRNDPTVRDGAISGLLPSNASSIDFIPSALKENVAISDLSGTEAGKTLTNVADKAIKENKSIKAYMGEEGHQFNVVTPEGNKIGIDLVSSSNQAAETGTPSNKIVAPNLPKSGLDTNVSPSLTSTREPGAAFKSTEYVLPSQTKNLDLADEVSIHNYVTTIQENSQKNVEPFSTNIEKATGIKPDVRVKKTDSILGKIERFKIAGKDPGEMSDILASRIVVPKGDVNTQIENIKKNFDVVETSNFFENPTGWGYTGVNMKVKLPNGMPAEIQIHTKESLAVGNQIHKIYEKWRNLDVEKLTDTQRAEMQEDIKKSQDISKKINSEGISSSEKDIFNKPIVNEAPKANPDLITEAKKYKSAEEFIKAQGLNESYTPSKNPVMAEIPFKKVELSIEKKYPTNTPISEYTGFLTTNGKKAAINYTDISHRVLLNREGIPGFSEEFYLRHGGIRLHNTGKEINIEMGNKPTTSQLNELKKISSKKPINYDFRDSSTGYLIKSGTGDLTQLLSDIKSVYLTDKSQLTDIWNQANAKPEPKVEKTQDFPETHIQTLRDYYLKADPEKVGQAWYEVMTELEVARPGSRTFIEDPTSSNRIIIGESSTFPQWVPEELRKTDLFKKVLEGISNPDTMTYPPNSMPRRQELYDIILAEIDSRAGLDSSQIISTIKTEYGKTRENKQVETGADRGITGSESTGKTDSKKVNTTTEPVKENKPTPSNESTGISRLQERISEQLLEIDQGKYAVNPNDGTYDKIKLDKDANDAVKFLQKDPEKALRIAKGLESGSNVTGDLTTNAISLAVALKAKQEGNVKLWNDLIIKTSLRSTRYGQEIVTLRGQFNNNSPENFVKQVLDTRLKRLGDSIVSTTDSAMGKGIKKSAKVKAIERIDREVAKAQDKIHEKIKKDRIKIKMAQDIIDSLICK